MVQSENSVGSPSDILGMLDYYTCVPLEFSKILVEAGEHHSRFDWLPDLGSLLSARIESPDRDFKKAIFRIAPVAPFQDKAKIV